jgi:hypothetical protein
LSQGTNENYEHDVLSDVDYSVKAYFEEHYGFAVPSSLDSSTDEKLYIAPHALKRFKKMNPPEVVLKHLESGWKTVSDYFSLVLSDVKESTNPHEQLGS